MEKVQIPTVSRPKPVQLNDVRVHVVNSDTLDEFIAEFSDKYGDVAFVALSIKDYENLALNVAELKRFINQQKQIIIYYEDAVSDEEQNINTNK